MESSLIFNGPPTLIWDWRVAVDLYLGGIGVGAFLVAVLADWRYAGRYHRFCGTAAVAAPVFVALGLLLLLTKMGRPMALFLTFTTFAPSSPLWWGGIFQLLFIVAAAYYALLWLRPEEDATHRRRMGWLLLPLPLVVGAYHGFLLSVMPARPLWNTGPTVVAALLGGITTGIAAVMLIQLLRMKVAGRLADEVHSGSFLGAVREFRTILGATLVLQACTLFIWWVSLLYGPQGAQTALANANAAHGPVFWIVGIGLGLMLPLLIGGYAVLRGERIGVSWEVNTIWITSTLILVGGLVFRLAVVLGGQAGRIVHTLS